VPREFLNLEKAIMDSFLYEIFDTKLDLVWQKHGDYELTAFIWDEQQFIIQIGPAVTVENAFEVCFFRNEDSNQAFLKPAKSSDVVPSTVYGVVLNALADKISDVPFYFSAEYFHSQNNKQFQQTVKLYEMLARRIARQKNGYFYQRRNRPNEFLVSLKQINNAEWIDPRRASLTEFLKTGPFVKL
jgi:hypothetical protein